MKYRVEVRTYPLDIQNANERYIYENIKFKVLGSKLRICCQEANMICRYAGNEYSDVSKLEFEITDIHIVTDVFIIYRDVKIRLEFIVCEDLDILDHNFPMSSRINGTKKLFIYFDYSSGEYYKYIDFLHPTLNIEIPCDYICISSFYEEYGNAFIMSKSYKMIIFPLLNYLVSLASKYDEVIIMGCSIGTAVSMLLKKELPKSKLIISAPATNLFLISSNLIKTPSLSSFYDYFKSLYSSIDFSNTYIYTSEYDHHYDKNFFDTMKKNGATLNITPIEEKIGHDGIMKKYKDEIFELILKECSQ